jgi:hypothetical protein
MDGKVKKPVPPQAGIPPVPITNGFRVRVRVPVGRGGSVPNPWDGLLVCCAGIWKTGFLGPVEGAGTATVKVEVGTGGVGTASTDVDDVVTGAGTAGA